jgi:urease accessory protein
VALSNAHEAVERGDVVTVIAIDHALHTMKLAKEAREGSVKTGRRLLATARRLSSSEAVNRLADAAAAGDTPGNYAVAWGAVTAATGIPRREAMLAELHAFSLTLLSAAVRMGRLTYLQAQDVLKGASETIAEVVEENIGRSIGEIRSFAPMIDLMAMHHQRAERRLFVS